MKFEISRNRSSNRLSFNGVEIPISLADYELTRNSQLKRIENSENFPNLRRLLKIFSRIAPTEEEITNFYQWLIDEDETGNLKQAERHAGDMLKCLR